MRGCSSLPIKKKSRGTGCIGDLVAAYGLTQPAGGGKILFTIPMKSSWLSMAPWNLRWNLRLTVESTIQSLARNCLFCRVSCTPYAILDARPSKSVNHLEARVAFCVRLEAFAPRIRHFSLKLSFVNHAQIS